MRKQPCRIVLLASLTDQAALVAGVIIRNFNLDDVVTWGAGDGANAGLVVSHSCLVSFPAGIELSTAAAMPLICKPSQLRSMRRRYLDDDAD